MYIPKAYRLVEDAPVRQLIEENPFALVQCVVQGRIESVHLPIHLLEEHPIRLGLHLPMHNPMAGFLASASEVYVVVTGPHTMIPTAWQLPDSVPTWNYLTVHMRCKCLRMSEPELLAFLPLQARRLERVPENPFMFEQMAPTALERRMAVLQGFYLTVESWEGIAKLSQDEPEQLQHHLKSCLKAAGEDTLVEWMNRLAESKETT